MIPRKVQESILKILTEAELPEIEMICVPPPVKQSEEHYSEITYSGIGQLPRAWLMPVFWSVEKPHIWMVGAFDSVLGFCKWAVALHLQNNMLGKAWIAIKSCFPQKILLLWNYLQYFKFCKIQERMSNPAVVSNTHPNKTAFKFLFCFMYISVAPHACVCSMCMLGQWRPEDRVGSPWDQSHG